METSRSPRAAERSARGRARAAVLAIAFLLSACTAAPAPGDGDGNADAKYDAVVFDDDGAVGSLGRELLRDSITAVEVEIDATEGLTLTGASRAALNRELSKNGGKDRVRFDASDGIEAMKVYTEADLRAIGARTRETASTATALALHVLVLDGSYEDEDALGIAFDATSVAVFPDRIRAGLLPTLNYDAFETAVVVHELGHLFGLVNVTGKGAFHEDADHRGHSSSKDSVMYWAVEDVSIGNVFRGGPPTAFDAKDREEMAGIRG